VLLYLYENLREGFFGIYCFIYVKPEGSASLESYCFIYVKPEGSDSLGSYCFIYVKPEGSASLGSYCFIYLKPEGSASLGILLRYLSETLKECLKFYFKL
jgi:hypothetical protein